MEICILMIALNGTQSYDCDWTLTINEYKYGQYNAFTDWETKHIHIQDWAYHFGIDLYGNNILWHEIKHAMCRCMWHAM